MSKSIQSILISDYLKNLGIEDEGAQLYASLVEKGPCSILELSRVTEVERTKIYRLIDTLAKVGVVEEVIDYKRRLLKAADVNTIKYLVDSNARKADELSKNFEAFTNNVNSLVNTHPSTSVQFYRGQDGIKQMLWNELKAHSESLCFIYKIFDTFVGEKFFDHWAEEFTKRGLSSREIRTDIFDKSFAEKPNPICFHMSNVQLRYIPSEDFPITHGVTIYDDVTAIYDFWENEIFGLEIHNKKVANMQRIFFETYWDMAKPISNKKYLKKIVKTY